MAADGDTANETHGDDGKQGGKMLHIPFIKAFKETPKMKEVAGIFFMQTVNPSSLLWFFLMLKQIWSKISVG